MRRNAFLSLAVGLFLTCPPLGSAGAAGELDDPDARLSQGEVLEMASGEVEKAMALYHEVLSLQGLADPVRARGLYLLARCEQKLGNLENAKRLLEEIEAKHSGGKSDPSLYRRALRFLAQINDPERAGSVDWFEGLKENETIQSQIFQLAMELVSPESDEALKASRKLLAMGSLAQPVLRTVIQTTRDPRHRREVAFLLAQMGDLSELRTALDPLNDPNWLTGSSEIVGFFDALLGAKPDVRAAFLKAEAALPPDKLGAEIRLLLRLAAAPVSELERELDAIEGWPADALGKTAGVLNVRSRSLRLIVRQALERQVRDDPAAAAPIVVRRFLKRESNLREPCFEALYRSAPDALTGQVLLDAGEQFWSRAVEILWVRKDHAAIAAIIEHVPEPLWPSSPAAPKQQEWERGLRDVIGNWLKKIRPDEEPASLGGVIRAALEKGAAGPSGMPSMNLFLHFFLLHDPALGDLERALRALAGAESRFNLNQCDWTNLPAPSAAFCALFRKLALDDDPKVRQHIVVKCIDRVVSHDPAFVEVLERVLLNSKESTGEELSAARRLLYAAAAAHPDRAADCARILGLDFERSPNPSTPPALSDAYLAVFKQLVLRLERPSEAARARGHLASIPTGSRPRPPRPPQSHQDMSGPLTDGILAAIEKHRSGPARALLAESVCELPAEFVRERKPIADFLDAFIADSQAPDGPRLRALAKRIKETPFPILKEFLARDDPKALEAIPIGSPAGAPEKLPWIENRSPEEKRQILDILRRHPSRDRRFYALSLAQKWAAPDLIEILAEASKDSDAGIRAFAVMKLGETEEPRVVAILIKALADPDESVRETVIHNLTPWESPDAMEGLIRALDDRSAKIRDAAGAALQKIKQQLQERKEWKEWLENVKKGRP